MYELRPLITFDAPIEFPNCMYRQKNIHADEENGPVAHNYQDCQKFSGTFKQNIEGKEMAELLERQEKLLSQLEELKKVMQSIKSNLKVTNENCLNTSTLLKTSTISCKVQVDIPDIVINANPLYPPYFLLFLQRLLKNEVNLNVNCYLHSSIANPSGVNKEFVSNLNKNQVNNGLPSVNIRLIWKRIGPHAELNVSHYPIQGEANILRYLVRTLDGNLNYEKNPNPEEIDNLLDISYRLSYNMMKSTRNNLQYLNKSLANGSWLGGRNSMTIADIAVFNCLKKIDNNGCISNNLSKWFNQCEQFIKP